MSPCVPPLLLLLLLVVVRVSGAADDVSSAVLPGRGQRTLQVAAPAPAPADLPISVVTRVRLMAGLAPPSSSCRVSFSVSHGGSLNTWEVELRPGQQEATVEKTLCVAHNSSLGSVGATETTTLAAETQQPIYIVAYSRTQHKLRLDISSRRNEQFMLRAGAGLEVGVSQHASQVFQYNFQPGEEAVLLRLESVSRAGEDTCMYVSVDSVACPWHSSAQTMQWSQLWARVLRLGYFTLKAEDFPGGGFQVTLITLASNQACISPNHKPRLATEDKRVSLRVERLELSYTRPVAVSLVVVTALALAFSALWFFTWYFWASCFEEAAEEDGDTDAEATQEAEVDGKEPSDSRVLAALEAALQEPAYTEEERTVIEAARRRLARQEQLCLADMAVVVRECVWQRRARSYGYLLVVPLLSLFYLIPSFQLVYAEWRRSEDAGNRDRCYHNHGCARPYGPLPDFNHMISNMGYIIYGLFFILIVFIKSQCVPENNKPSVDHRGDKGIIQQYSIFYTLGICMILQGAFSATFHICPSNVSLQFDTSMMYMMLVLSFIKTFQFRHPDTSANVFSAMYAFCILIFLESVSLYITDYSSKVVFHGLCGVLYLGFIVYLSLDNYYYGAIAATHRVTLPIICQNLCEPWKSRHPYRLTLMVLFFLINAVLVLVFFMKAQADDEVYGLSTPILLLCGVNVFLYLSQYLFKKMFEICRAEDGTGTSCFVRMCLLLLFLILFLSFGVVAGYFYSNKHQSRNLSPAESRNKNELCNFGDFYDNHDIWHFLSSTALFLAFLFLLTIDDDLFDTRRKEIKVY